MPGEMHPERGHGEALAPPRGPLTGLRVVEFAGLGPAPFACMMLSDMGADVVTVDRTGRGRPGGPGDVTGRGRTVVHADLKDSSERDRVLDLVDQADALVEGFRPGVMERLGLGPEVVCARNPRLVYGRMTGWGQSGPLAHAAGHDLNYIAITGALHAIGPAGGAPVPPLNLVGDYGGGALYLVVGLLAALHEARQSGQGQVVDAAITDGVLSMLSILVMHQQRGIYREERGSNLLDGGAPFYGVYRTAEGQYVSVGAIEPQFFAEICQRMGVQASLLDAQHDQARWPQLRAEFERIFATRTRAEWTTLLEGHDTCFAPVLSLSEAHHHPHVAAREGFVDVEGTAQPAPAPRFSRTPSAIRGPSPRGSVSVLDAVNRWTSPAKGAAHR